MLGAEILFFFFFLFFVFVFFFCFFFCFVFFCFFFFFLFFFRGLAVKVFPHIRNLKKSHTSSIIGRAGIPLTKKLKKKKNAGIQRYPQLPLPIALITDQPKY